MKRTSGFSLVEVTVVVAVIAILATLTVYSYDRVTSQSKTSSQETAIKTIELKAKAKGVRTGSILPDVNYIASWKLETLNEKLYPVDTDTTARNKDRIYFDTRIEGADEFIELYWWNALDKSWMHSSISSSGQSENLPGTPIDVTAIPAA